MSLIPKITERPRDMGLTHDENGISASRVFDIVARSQLDALRILKRETGIAYGSRYATSYGEHPGEEVICRAINISAASRAAPIGGDGLFTASCTFSTRGSSGRQAQPIVGGPPVYLWRTSLYQAEADTDRDGNRITNTAGQTVKVPIVVPMASLTVKWYTNAYSVAQNIRLTGAVNGVKWLGAQPAQGKCMGITPEPQSENLFLMQANFEFQEIGWQPKVINEGLQELLRLDPEAAAGEPGEYGADGVKGASWPSPVLLDANGKRLTTGDPIINTVNLYREADFTKELGI